MENVAKVLSPSSPILVLLTLSTFRHAQFSATDFKTVSSNVGESVISRVFSLYSLENMVDKAVISMIIL